MGHINIRNVAAAAVFVGVAGFGLVTNHVAQAAAPIKISASSACQNWRPSTDVKGRASVTTYQASADGFGRAEAKVAAKLAIGSYDAYLVDLYKADDGTILGCSGNPSRFTVRNSGTTVVRVSQPLFMGNHTVQVVVVPAGTAPADLSAYATAPVNIVVPGL